MKVDGAHAMPHDNWKGGISSIYFKKENGMIVLTKTSSRNLFFKKKTQTKKQHQFCFTK